MSSQELNTPDWKNDRDNWWKERAEYYATLKAEKQAEIEDKRKKERADRIFNICCGIGLAMCAVALTLCTIAMFLIYFG